MEPEKFEQARLLKIDIDNNKSVLKHIQLAKDNHLKFSIILFQDSLHRDLSKINLSGPILSKVIDLIIEECKKELLIFEQNFSQL